MYTSMGFKHVARCFSEYAWYSSWLFLQCTPIFSGGLKPLTFTSLLQFLSSCLAPVTGLHLHIQPVVIHLGIMSFLMSKNYPTSLIQFTSGNRYFGEFHPLLSEIVLSCALVLVCFTLLPLCFCYSSGSSSSF